jgi:hypothetical protein
MTLLTVLEISQKIEFPFDLFLLLVSFIASLIGSTVQLTHKLLRDDLRKREILAVYSTGCFIAYFAYEAGMHFKSFPITGLTSSIFSYVSIDFILTIKASILYIIRGITKGIPDVILSALKNWLNGK